MNINPKSLVVSVDPNIPHRGVRQPLEKVLALLNAAGVQDHSMILTGYSLEKSRSNDSHAYTDYDPDQNWPSETSCENQMAKLARLAPRKFNFVLIDGNHEGSYFESEAEMALRLLSPGGLLIVDDVRDVWFEIREVFDRLADGEHFLEIYRDDRIAVARAISDREEEGRPN